jgi:hypothetical protein
MQTIYFKQTRGWKVRGINYKIITYQHKHNRVFWFRMKFVNVIIHLNMQYKVHIFSPKYTTVNYRLRRIYAVGRELNEVDVHGSVHRRYISKYNKQDATLHNLFISVKCSTCSIWYLRPSSGVQNCIYTYSIGYFSNLYCCLPLSCSNSSTIAAGITKDLTSTRCSKYSFELLMMGKVTAWTM